MSRIPKDPGTRNLTGEETYLRQKDITPSTGYYVSPDVGNDTVTEPFVRPMVCCYFTILWDNTDLLDSV